MRRLGLIEKDTRQDDFSEVRPRQRLHELHRLVRYRRTHDLGIGRPEKWAAVVCDIAMALQRIETPLAGHEIEDSPSKIRDLFVIGTPAREKLKRRIIGHLVRIELGDLVETLPEDEMIWPRGVTPGREGSTEILDGGLVGILLGVTSIERDACDLRTINAVEETPYQRSLRLNRQARAHKRHAAGATPRARSKSAVRPWEALGISRATWYRRQSR